jgi:hypothetical protein
MHPRNPGARTSACQPPAAARVSDRSRREPGIHVLRDRHRRHRPGLALRVPSADHTPGRVIWDRGADRLECTTVAHAFASSGRTRRCWPGREGVRSMTASQDGPMRLTASIEGFCRTIEQLPARAFLVQPWGPRQVLAHLVFWHENYVRQVEAGLSRKGWLLPEGTFETLNARAVASLAGVGVPTLLARYRHSLVFAARMCRSNAIRRSGRCRCSSSRSKRTCGATAMRSDGRTPRGGRRRAGKTHPHSAVVLSPLNAEIASSGRAFLAMTLASGSAPAFGGGSLRRPNHGSRSGRAAAISSSADHRVAANAPREIASSGSALLAMTERGAPSSP